MVGRSMWKEEYEYRWSERVRHLQQNLAGGKSLIQTIARTRQSCRLTAIGSPSPETPAELILDVIALYGADIIIDVGAGLGDLLTELILMGAATPANCWAVEPTKSGVAGCSLLSHALDTRFNVAQGSLESGLDFIGSTTTKTLIYTHHSIEQVQYLSPHIFEGWLKLFPNLTVVNMEPCGFQMPGAWPGDHAQQMWIKKRDWNENLWAVLESLNTRKQIKIISPTKKHWIRRGLVSPTSLITWQNINKL